MFRRINVKKPQCAVSTTNPNLQPAGMFEGSFCASTVHRLDPLIALGVSSCVSQKYFEVPQQPGLSTIVLVSQHARLGVPISRWATAVALIRMLGHDAHLRPEFPVVCIGVVRVSIPFLPESGSFVSLLWLGMSVPLLRRVLPHTPRSSPSTASGTLWWRLRYRVRRNHLEGLAENHDCLRSACSCTQSLRDLNYLCRTMQKNLQEGIKGSGKHWLCYVSALVAKCRAEVGATWLGAYYNTSRRSINQSNRINQIWSSNLSNLENAFELLFQFWSITIRNGSTANWDAFCDANHEDHLRWRLRGLLFSATKICGTPHSPEVLPSLAQRVNNGIFYTEVLY